MPSILNKGADHKLVNNYTWDLGAFTVVTVIALFTFNSLSCFLYFFLSQMLLCSVHKVLAVHGSSDEHHVEFLGRKRS